MTAHIVPVPALEAAVRGGHDDGKGGRIITTSLSRINGHIRWSGSLILADGETHERSVVTDGGHHYIEVEGASLMDVAQRILELVPGIQPPAAAQP